MNDNFPLGIDMASSGIRAERDLVHKFWDAGFAVLRSPASGGGTTLPRPDLIAGSVTRDKFLVLEIKTVRKDTLYINEDQISGLIEFAKRIGFEPYVGVKFKNRRKGFFFLKAPDKLERVKNSSNYKITFAFASSKGLSFGELIGDYLQEKLV
ncbi:MAG: Holliday junction resolvase [Asgard group archaeon]|nr:Holliday junction resolvase [Asgard group archaeon]